MGVGIADQRLLSDDEFIDFILIKNEKMRQQAALYGRRRRIHEVKYDPDDPTRGQGADVN
jgi:hypothetical protein